jgi:hypothetical protein
MGFAFAWICATVSTPVPAAAQTSPGSPTRSRRTAPGLLTGIPEDKVVRKPVLERDALRRRFVRVAPDALGRLSSFTTLGLELFDDRYVQARLIQVRGHENNGFTWFGFVPGEEIGDVILTVMDGVMMGTIHLGAESIHLRALDRETYEVMQIDRASLGPDHDASDEPVSGDLGDLKAADDTPPPADGWWAARARRNFLRRNRPYKAVNVGPLDIRMITDSGHRIDIMVAYTKEAAAAVTNLVDYDGQPFSTITNIHLAIQHSLDKVNFVLPFSGIPTVFNLVHTVKLKDPEPNVSPGDMVEYMNEGDGMFEELIDLADQYHADITSLFIAGGPAFGACGRGSILPELVEPADQVYLDGRGRHWKIGKNAVKVECAVRGLTLPHEIGHNAGLLHDRYVSSWIPAVDGGRGFVLVPVRKRTIMAYDDLCRDFFPDEVPQNPPFDVCPRLPRYSNPAASHDGWPLGMTGGDVIDHVDAVTAFERALWTVANFRHSLYDP